MGERDNDEPVDTYELAVSNMIAIEALVGLLVKKGVTTTEEILEEVNAVRDDMVRKRRGSEQER